MEKFEVHVCNHCGGMFTRILGKSGWGNGKWTEREPKRNSNMSSIRRGNAYKNCSKEQKQTDRTRVSVAFAEMFVTTGSITLIHAQMHSQNMCSIYHSTFPTCPNTVRHSIFEKQIPHLHPRTCLNLKIPKQYDHTTKKLTTLN